MITIVNLHVHIYEFKYIYTHTHNTLPFIKWFDHRLYVYIQLRIMYVYVQNWFQRGFYYIPRVSSHCTTTTMLFILSLLWSESLIIGLSFWYHYFQFPFPNPFDLLACEDGHFCTDINSMLLYLRPRYRTFFTIRLSWFIIMFFHLFLMCLENMKEKKKSN